MSSSESVVVTIPQALERAIELHRAGNLSAAEQIYRQILVVDPRHADAMQLLGVIANQVGKPELAVGLIQAALELNPHSAMYYNNLGESYRALHREAEAIACYERSLALEPNYGDACNNLGIIYQHQGRLDEAARLYRLCLASQPNQVEALSNLGTVVQAQGDIDSAAKLFEMALSINPRHAPTHNNLGRVFTDRGDYLAAERAIETALQIKPDLWLAYENLAVVRRAQGKTEKAREAFEKAIEHLPNDGLKIQHALLTPIIYESREEIDQVRRQIRAALDRFNIEPLSVEDPAEKIGVNLFYLPYHGFDDRELQQEVAALFRRVSPSLDYVAEHCVSERRRPGGDRTAEGGGGADKIRVGMISKYFFEHSVGRHNEGIIRHLDRERFHVTLFHFPGSEDATTERICSSADRTVKLSTKLSAARAQIAQARLDALIYTDIGMDPWTYFLSFSRLAPVQCVLPGHPVTTGVPNLDYFLSSAAMEPPGAQAHYSEQLVQFENLPSYFMRPKLPEQAMSRADFGLPAETHLYAVGQMLFKLHPDFDLVLRDILLADPAGEIVLFEGYQRHWTDVLKRRLRRSIPDVLDRVRMMPWMKVADYLQLLNVVDVSLDTFPFSGGTTSMQALALGLPVVTCPGEFMRGQTTAAIYRKLDFMECVARDRDDYVRIAARLGSDPRRRERVRKAILERVELLYENIHFIKELERFLIEKVPARG